MGTSRAIFQNVIACSLYDLFWTIILPLAQFPPSLMMLLYGIKNDRFFRLHPQSIADDYATTRTTAKRTSRICIFNNKISSFTRLARDLHVICAHFTTALVLSTTSFVFVCTWTPGDKFLFSVSISKSLIPILVTFFTPKNLEIIEEWSQKPKVTFSDELLTVVDSWKLNRERKRTRRGGQHECHKFAYLTMRNSSFARFSRAFLISVHFVAAKSRPADDMKYLFCRCVNDVNTWQQLIKFVFLSLKRWFQFNSMILKHALRA